VAACPDPQLDRQLYLVGIKGAANSDRQDSDNEGGDGGVTISRYNQSMLWVYHSPPVACNFSGMGVSSIGGIGGSYRGSTEPSETTTTTMPPEATTTTTTVSAVPWPASKVMGEANPELKNLRANGAGYDCAHNWPVRARFSRPTAGNRIKEYMV
jgi:hypothetical protein